MAENLQEYYKRMAEAIDTQLEQKGKAALLEAAAGGSSGRGSTLTRTRP